MPEAVNYELAPRPGQTASQRKAELDQARFIAIRNLAYMIYKKPDGSPLLSYPETLDDREKVKNTIIQHELSLNLLVNDGGAAAQPQTQPAQPVATQPGVPQMTQPVPVQSYQQPIATPAQAAQVPQQAPQQMSFQPPMAAAPQQMAMPPQYQQPAAPAAVPAQTAAPAAAEPAPTGRKRRGAGAAVAPPPAAPPPSGPVQPVPTAAPVYGAPAPQMAAPQMAAPQMAAPQMAVPFAAPPMAAPQMQMPQAPMQQAPTATADLTPVIQRVDSLGKGLEVAVANSDAALKAVQQMAAELTETRLVTMQALTCLHHIYSAIQGVPGGAPLFAQALQGVPGDLNGFRQYLMRYIGQLPAAPSPK